MTDTPLPPPDSPESPIPWGALEDLAAGDLPPAEARDLQARIDQNPALAKAYAEAERLEALLRAEAPYAAPLGLTQRVLAVVVPEATFARPRPLATLARVAAVVLVFFSSWLIVGGETPALAAVREAPLVTAALPTVKTSAVVPEPDRWYRSPVLAEATAVARPESTESVPGEPLVFAAAGLLVLGLGVGLAARWHRAPARSLGGVK
ncbi:MAG: hypothetical protein QNJ98_07055 [Planctomycetota bacterium]|nr:hypothetical protein [Planctomycetota bacterium]